MVMESAIQNIAKEAVELGHEVHVVTGKFGAEGRPREECAIYALTFISLLALALSMLMAPGIDKSSIDSAFYILNRLPFTFWIGVGALAFALLLCLSQRNWMSSHIVALVMVSIMYMELPRLMYENCFQIEYFHQAQTFHVLNYGTVTDAGYPYPPADVAHAIFSAVLIEVTGSQAEYAVSHVLPILLRLALAISILSIAAYFKTSKYGLCFFITAPLYVFISDTEPSFTNHYIFVLPLYAIFIYLIIKFEDEQQSQLLYILLLTASSIVFSHIYFATLITISLFAHFSFNKVARRMGNLNMSHTLTPIVIFLLWHGFICEWSVWAFYKEINYALLPAVDRFLTFEINPLTYVSKAEERYGSIPIKSDYLNVLMLKHFIVLAINIIMLCIIMYALFHAFRKQGFTNTALNLLTRRITYTWGFSALFLAIYGLTGTAHPQRLLEAFAITNCGLALLLLRSLEGDLKISKELKGKKGITALVLAITLMSIFFIPLKVVAHWGTSLTYMGFSQKSIHEVEYIATYGNPETCIHYVGPTPYWFLTEIVNKWSGSYVYDLNGHEGEIYFTETLANIERSLDISEPHYIYYSLSSLSAMRAKYDIEHSLDMFIKAFDALSSKTNIIYVNSITEKLGYVG
jgi:hypothetical protein